MATLIPCIECGVAIQAATAASTGGRCMPCRRRGHTRLSPDQESAFEAALSRYVDAGWEEDALSRRAWLDLRARLRHLVQRSPDRLWEALGVCDVEVAATKEPALDVALSVGRLRSAASGLFPAEHVQQRFDGTREVVSFDLYALQYEIPVTPAGRANAFSLLVTANLALAEHSCTHRFHGLARKRGRLLIAIARPETIARSLQQGLCPSAT